MKAMWTDFQKPKWVEVDRDTLTGTYGRFVAEPFERGFGITIGNSLRRVLLSSVRGAAITAVRLEGVYHEFSVMSGVVEDVADILLNLKEVRLRMEGEEPRKLRLKVKGPKEVTAGDLETDAGVTLLNPELHLAQLQKEGKLEGEIIVRKGRGYVPAERNADDSLGTQYIPLDAVFSPIRRVNFQVENTRVGRSTDYDKLILEVWTDGSISPEDSVSYAAKNLKDHLQIFIHFEEEPEVEETREDEHKRKLIENLKKSVDELELSVRSYNCLKNANIRTLHELVQKTEQEMLKTRNFGRKSLTEIKQILDEMGLSLGMKLDDLEPAILSSDH
ncbi:MAG: DNA-directed RNA polymerase subunit alpha [Candidatus Tectomicrobia bacterium]|nr:DNA-directed RNA polymerase subunit alpha [Candidatus Tectomicrobia bacterium]